MTTADVDYGRNAWDGFGLPGLSREASDEMRQHIADSEDEGSGDDTIPGE